MKTRKNLYWLLGFLGFLGLRYFYSHNLADLVWVAYFAFFPFYVVGRVNDEVADEMYEANRHKALELAYPLALIGLFIITFGIGLFGLSEATLVVLATCTIFVSLFAYAIRFYQLERGSSD